jgi:tRNA dimethylallyltransferase
LSSDTKKTVVIICGPTGAGKTSVAIQIAKHFQTEIISADSRQCFQELNIGVARPSVQELTEVKHHFIASYSIHEEVNAAVFEKFALEKTKELFQQHDVIVMVGGTGLYIKAFSEGLDSIPGIDPAIREDIIHNYETKGLEWLQQEVKLKDPLFYEKGEIQNPQRMMRALEVMESTGQSIVSFHKTAKTKRDFTIINIGLELPKEELHRNINTRTDKMMEAGLLNEVKDLLPYKTLNALQTVGYKELFDHLQGDISLDDAVGQIKTNTRQYAKRQMTWFKKDRSIRWFHPNELEKMKELTGKEIL